MAVFDEYLCDLPLVSEAQYLPPLGMLGADLFRLFLVLLSGYL